MKLIRLQNMVPEVYPNNSRDFQLFCRLYDCVFNGNKFDIDSILDICDTEYIDSKLLRLLQSKFTVAILSPLFQQITFSFRSGASEPFRIFDTSSNFVITAYVPLFLFVSVLPSPCDFCGFPRMGSPTFLAVRSGAECNHEYGSASESDSPGVCSSGKKQPGL